MPVVSTAIAGITTALTAAGTAAGTAIAGAGLGGAAAAGTAAGATAAGTAAAGGGISAAGLAGITGALGTATQVGGLALNYYGQQAQAEASQEAEALRKKQLALDTARRRREIIREGLIARSQGLNAQAGAGLEIGPATSAYGGLIGQNTTETSNAYRAEVQNAAIGSALFDANAAYSEAGGISSIGQGISQFGNALANPQTALAAGRVGKTIFDRV